MPTWLQIALGLVPVVAVAWNMITAKTDRARLEGAFAATVDAKLAVMNQRFDNLQRGQDAMTGTVKDAMARLEMHATEIAILKDRSARDHGGR